MSTNKKRKLDVGQGTQMLSAAALRRRLLERQASSSAISEGSVGSQPEDQAANPGPSSAGRGGPTAKAASSRQQQKRESSRALEDVLLGQSGVLVSEDVDVSEAVDEPPKRKVVQLSSTTLNRANSQRRADGTVLLRLTDSSERLVILGNYGFRVKHGEASIYGAALTPSDAIHWVHAPYCHALPVLRCSENSMVELHSHPEAPALRSLARLSPTFTSLWSRPVAEAPSQTWQVLGSSADAPKKAIVQDLRSPPEWNRKTAQLLSTASDASATAHPIYFLCGPKSSGKSTYARMLANKLLTHRAHPKQLQTKWPAVAILDIDPGQPEFSPPGTISLVRLDTPNLSPPFCHPLLPQTASIRSHAVAAITPASDIAHYKSCVLDLFARYQSNEAYTGCPLLVNTPGWIQGSGLVLLQDLVCAIRPTEILYMSEDGPEDTVDGLKAAAAAAAGSATHPTRSCPLTKLPSQSSEYTSRTALHLRHMQALSYFHIDAEQSFDISSSNNKNKNKAGPHWDDKPLSFTPPIFVKYSTNTSRSGIAGIVCYGYQPEPELLADAINGSILAIVEIEDPKAYGGYTQPQLRSDDTTSANTDTTNSHTHPAAAAPPRTAQHQHHEAHSLPYIRTQTPLDPRYSHCLGLALIRGIDTARGEIALSTPIAPLLLSSFDTTTTNNNNNIGDDDDDKNKNRKPSSNSKPIVLIAGKFDQPTWAYTEDHYHRALRKTTTTSSGQEELEDYDDNEDDNSDVEMPWTEKLRGNQKRAVGSKVWRVRRDLGRGGGGGD
ncbi:hypothetical protein BD289DRAFT_430164 [Coniella lustricola]|uniref:Polynucleotide 5'-hydroxyl-kinase GRC3 n=1 Tax=Coniella lustricola TaxID=2025994 RepID=A0A2T3ACC8_9PEZI|nr:hypothetical protein BD289DRAFT_430164 [Coniella lustricola]